MPVEEPRVRLQSRLRGFGTTIFAEMTRLADQHGAVNLGQGFPDFDGPDWVKEHAVRALASGKNQYARSHGVPALNRAIADHHLRFYGQRWDPDAEVTVTSGATEAIAATLLGVCEEGDEVILFEPFYDSYMASVAMAGATARVVTLRAPGFRIDEAALREATSPRTRAIIVNSPNNPTGRVFDDAELAAVARVAVERDLVCLSDEVYEHLVYEGRHTPLATLPGMRERTVQVSSAGKTFSLTGWKVGWACAAPPLTRAVRAAHQFLTFSTATPFQHAIAEALAAPDAYYQDLVRDYAERRERLCAGLEAAGFGVLRPAGTYFAMADIRPLGFDDDVAFCRALPERVGVVAIPPTAFYVRKDEGRHLVRFAFCKTRAVLDRGIERLQRLRHEVGARQGPGKGTA